MTRSRRSAALATPSPRSAPSSSPTAAASTAPISRCVADADARRPRPGRHRRQPELSRAASPARRPRSRDVRPPPPDHPDARTRTARVPRQSRQPLLLLQARALHAPVAHRRRPRRRRRRRQQRRRPRRLPARAGRPRASSACAARSTKWTSARTTSASSRGSPGCRRGTSRRRRACRRAFRTTPK